MNAATLCHCTYSDGVTGPESSLGKMCFVTGETQSLVPILVQFDPYLYALSNVKPEDRKPHPGVLFQTVRNYYSTSKPDATQPSSVEFFKAFAQPHVLYIGERLREAILALSEINLCIHMLKWYLVSSF